jgi:hypothetical protein
VRFGAGRRQLIAEQNPSLVTGIDFVLINPADRRQLSVFFVIDPDDLDQRPVNTGLVPVEFSVTIIGVEDGREVGVADVAWATATAPGGGQRTVLLVLAEEDGGFQNFRLALTDTPADSGASRLDPFAAETTFSFKQGCPTGFDCRRIGECLPEARVDWPVDYLARDFESFRQALMAFSAQRYPDWAERIPADFGGMVAELLAALGDEFSYVQDFFGREGFWDTLTQRRSLHAHARLVDYFPDPGQSATTLLSVGVDPAVPGIVLVPAGAAVWAILDGEEPVPFEVGTGLADMRAGTLYPVRGDWADMPMHVVDPERPCLPAGARELFVAGNSLLQAPFPPGVVAGDIAGYWVGRRVAIETRPTDPAEPQRRFIAIIDEPVQAIVDPLAPGGPITVTRLHFRAEDVQDFEIDKSRGFVTATLVPAIAGRSVVELCRMGAAVPPGFEEAIRIVERNGAFDNLVGERTLLARHSLVRTAPEGLGWTLPPDASPIAPRMRPEVAIDEIDPALGPATVREWPVVDDPLSLDERDRGTSLEPGQWREIAVHERMGVRLAHVDYAADAGWTIRFGDNRFGRAPEEGNVFRITYRTGPGKAANLPPDTVTALAHPAGLAGAGPVLPATIASVRNPLAITDGRDPEPTEIVKRIAPEAYRAILFRAVRDEDYREQAERLPWVQQAGAVSRWTGSWMTTFVTPDPRDAFVVTPEQRAELVERINCVRQVRRDVVVRDPVFLNVDLKIAICLRPGAYFGQVSEAVIRALVGPQRPGWPAPFFDPDNFTFGDPLLRTELEARIAGVPGVLAVPEIRYRLRDFADYAVFDTPRVETGSGRIIRLRNDPDRPGHGTLAVYDRHIPAEAGA